MAKFVKRKRLQQLNSFKKPFTALDGQLLRHCLCVLGKQKGRRVHYTLGRS